MKKATDIATLIMERMARMPPKLHKDMKLGKQIAKVERQKPIDERKERPASKGRVHKGKSRN